MHTTTRRTVIAGAATLPLLPAAALAAPVSLPLLPLTSYAMPADPVIAAHREWLAAYNANEAFLETGQEGDTPEGLAKCNRVWVARLALSDAVATTPAGLALQLRFAFAVFGDPGHDGDVENPDDFTFDDVAENQEGRLLRSMLATAENMAGVAS